MDSQKLVHIVDWPAYLHYVREDKPVSPRWRPPQVNLPVADFNMLADELSLVELGAFARLLIAYASAPAIDARRPTGPRRMTVGRVHSLLRTRNAVGPKLLGRLQEAGLVAVVTGEGEAVADHELTTSEPPDDHPHAPMEASAVVPDSSRKLPAKSREDKSREEQSREESNGQRWLDPGHTIPFEPESGAS